MDTETMTRELRQFEEELETNWSLFCHDLTNRLKELDEHLKNLAKHA